MVPADDTTIPFARFTGPDGVSRQPGLEGLRGLAVGAVVAFHLGFDGAGGGFLGVSLFFTLSGVLIGTLILNEVVTTGCFSLVRFWQRRARRLLPPALVTIAVVAVGRLMTTDLSATSRGDVVASGLNVANWHFLAAGSSYADLFRGQSALLHFWSLAIEEQFYVVVGLLAVVLAARAHRPVLVAFVSATVLAACSFAVPVLAGLSLDRTYYGSDTRAGELMVGVAAAAVLASPKRRRQILAAGRWIATAAAVGLASTLLLWHVLTPSSQALRAGVLPVTALCSLLVIVGAMLPTGPVAALTRWRLLGRLGGISYALYLVHWPVIVVADRLTDDRSLLRSGVLVAISVALAQLSAVLIEQPVRQRRLSPAALAAAAGLVVAAAGTVGAVDGRTTPSASLLGGLAEAAEELSQSPDSSAVTGDLPRIAIYGDSVGFSLLLGLGNTTVEPHFERAPSDVNLGCGIALSPSPPPDQPHLCDDPARRFAERAAGEDVTAAVMISCQWELITQPLPGHGDRLYTIGDPEFDQFVRLRYEDVANRLLAAGVDRVLWMRCPYLSSVVGIDGLAPRFLDSRQRTRVERLNEIITDLAVAREDVELLPFDDWVNSRVDDPAIRPDGSHYEYRAPDAADAFIEAINAALAAR